VQLVVFSHNNQINQIWWVFTSGMDELWKESLDSDGQQFYQYQQNVKPPLTSTHRTQKRPCHMMLEIQVLTRDRHKNVVVFYWLMRSLLTWSLDLQRQYRYKVYINKTCTDSLPMLKLYCGNRFTVKIVFYYKWLPHVSIDISNSSRHSNPKRT